MNAYVNREDSLISFPIQFNNISRIASSMFNNDPIITTLTFNYYCTETTNSTTRIIIRRDGSDAWPAPVCLIMLGY